MWSEETKERMAQAKVGKKHTKEHNEKIGRRVKQGYDDGTHIPWNKGETKYTHPSVARQAQKITGHIGVNKGKTGIYSKETLEKMSRARIQFYIDHPEAKLFGKDNPASRPEVRAKISKAHTGKVFSEEHKKTIGDAQRGIPLSEEVCLKRYGSGNPFYGKRHTKASIELIKQNVKKVFRDHPEKHSNRRMGKAGFVSEPQKELFELAREIFQDAELEYPIKTLQSTRFADIGVPSLRIDLEMDGEHWHQNKEYDMIRDKEIQEVGWCVVHFSDLEELNVWKERINSLRRD